MPSVESQKGIVAVSQCFVENQKDHIAVQNLWHLAPLWFSTDIVEQCYHGHSLEDYLLLVGARHCVIPTNNR